MAILGFKQYFPWKEPTNFREKILAGVGDKVTIVASQYFNPKTKVSTPVELKQLNPKIHTMRADPHNRWKAGMSIQMVYRGAKYSILDHFNKGIPELEKCVSIQKISIKVIPGHPDGGFFYEIRIDNGKELTRSEVEILALNDGFNSIYDFQKWFKKDFSGNILHWTDFRY